jgi:hypothetical protein
MEDGYLNIKRITVIGFLYRGMGIMAEYTRSTKTK